MSRRIVSPPVCSFNLCSLRVRVFPFQIKPAEAAARTAVVSLVCAAVELLPPRLVGDDNISVPVTALVVGRLLF